jgi:hypothetical protein
MTTKLKKRMVGQCRPAGQVRVGAVRLLPLDLAESPPLAPTAKIVDLRQVSQEHRGPLAQGVGLVEDLCALTRLAALR